MRGADFLFGYKCNQKGCCCRTWKIGLREADYHRMRRAALGTELEDDMAAGLQVRRPGPFAHLVPAAAQHQRFDSNFGAIAKEPDGSCTFLATDDLCRVHGVLGEAALPQICSNFPIGGMDTRDGPLSFWDFTCPEVVATLASATAPARVIEAPEAFTRETTVFRPVDGLARVALTSNSDVPWELVSAWHEDLWEAARTNAQQPLAVLGRAAWYVHAWATSGVSPGRFKHFEVTDEQQRTWLQHLSGRIVDAAEERTWLRDKVTFARQFFQHHPWGTEATLDVLEAAEPPAPELAAQGLASLGDAEHLVLTNWLIAAFQSVPLANNDTIENALLVLTRRLGGALYVAGTWARAGGGRLGAEGMASALGFAVIAYRSDRKSPPRFWSGRRLAVPRGVDQGRLASLPALVTHVIDSRAGAGPFADGDAALDAWRAVVQRRLRIALDGHAGAVKSALDALAEGGEFQSPDPWQSEGADDPASTDHTSARFELRRDEARAVARLAASDDSVPLALITRELALDPTEVGVLVTLLLVQTDTTIARSLAHVALAYDERRPSAAELAALFGGAARRALDPRGRLRRLRLVELATRPGGLPLEPTRYQLPASVVSTLLGGSGALPVELERLQVIAGRAAALLPPPRALVAAVRDATSGAGRARVVALVGPEGHDLVGLVSRAAGRGVVSVALEGSDAERSGADKSSAGDALVRAAGREALLRRSELLLKLDRAALALDSVVGAIEDMAALLPRPVYVATRRSPSRLYGRLDVGELELHSLDPAWSARLLARALPAEILIEDASALRDVVTSLSVPPDRVVAAVDRATGDALRASAAAAGARGRRKTRRRDRSRPTLTAAAFAAALREQMTSGLGDYARVMPVRQSWEDLQLTPGGKSSLDEVVSAYEHRHKVLKTWGFAGGSSGGNGVTALFYGPPGTGKTMASGILSRKLGLELFQIDLSRVVDKYIGETEKALGRVFDEAERGEVMLLFDEADSLFGQRTEVRSSTDRYANLEVNYLLQRMEAYRGVVVLTTNHADNMDPAFKRRIKHQVHFPMPGAEERARIWGTLAPAGAPFGDSVDFEELGQQFELSGGHIKNAMLTAAILAAVDDAEITQDHLLTACNREYRALGKVVREG